MTIKTESNKKTIGSVLKAVEIIELLAASEEEIGVTEISGHLNYGVSATYHLLNTLKISEMIEQNPKTKKYRLGLKLWKIGKLAREKNRLSSFVQPYLKELQESTEETANLTVLDNGEIMYIAQAESKKLIRMFTRIGARVPLHCSAAGKVLLAFLREEKQATIIEKISFKKFTEKTVTNAVEFKTQLKIIKEQGYAFDDEEREDGVSCIAAPIFDFDMEVIAAISISGPTMRFNQAQREYLIKSVLHTTSKVSAQLGYLNNRTL